MDAGTLFLCNPHEEDWAFGHKTTFAFNYVFSDEDAQTDVYAVAGVPLVDAVVDGHHATIIAYGQTGSGVWRCARPHRHQPPSARAVQDRAPLK